MKGCRTRQSGNLDTMGASKTQKFVVGAMEQGPIQNCVFVTISVRYPTITSQQWGLIEGPACKLCGKRTPWLIAYPVARLHWHKYSTNGETTKTWENWQMWWRKGQGKGIAGRSQVASNLSRRVRTKKIRGANCVRYRSRLGTKVAFPDKVEIILRPDMVVLSKQAKTIVVIELIVP